MNNDDFSLHALTKEIIHSSKSADPTEIAAQLVAQIPPAHLDHAVQQMARAYVRTVISTVRQKAIAPPDGYASRKIQAARERWRRLLDVPEFVPSLNGWIRLHEATREQVLEMAAHRMHQADMNSAAAKRYESIAKSMKTLKAQTVGDLPEDLLAETFGAKAAA